MGKNVKIEKFSKKIVKEKNIKKPIIQKQNSPKK